MARAVASRLMPDCAAYEAAFEKERVNEYPALEKIEAETGFALPRERLEKMARVLACPVKASPPNWQHGRLLYSLGRQYLESHDSDPVQWIDIGTAKGFSALCMGWAITQANRSGTVYSVDVIGPEEIVARNSVNDPATIRELIAPFRPATVRLRFYGGGSANLFVDLPRDMRIGFAFVDGKHTFDAVTSDMNNIAARQDKGDVIVFDDLQIESVARAVNGLKGYAVEEIEALPTRRYGVAVKQ